MRTKALITSIVLGLTVVVLIGYFVVGCSSLKDVALRQTQEQPVANAEVHEPDTKVEPQSAVTAEPGDSSEMIAVVNATSRPGKKLVVAGKPDPAVDSLVLHDGEPAKPTADVAWAEVGEVRDVESGTEHDVAVNYSDPAPGARPTPPVAIGTPRGPAVEPLREGQAVQGGGMMRDGYKPQNSDPNAYGYGGGGGRDFTYKSKYIWSGVDRPDRSGDSRSGSSGGGMGGMGGGSPSGRGGYGGGGFGGGVMKGYAPTDPRAQSSTARPNRAPGLSRVGGRPGSPFDRQTPVDLINVSADELWVITKAEGQVAPVAGDDEDPGCGAMLAKLPKKDKKIPLPLKHTDVRGQISGYIATVNVIQQFHNPYDEKIEAVYVFPLPQNAAINEFIMTIGKRRIRGIIRERKEAERIYSQARRQGHVASLLTQERPNIFTQKVANIEPSRQIDVNIKYFNTLAYADGWYEFVFPMVVGPRFNPPGFTVGVGAVARGKAGISGQRAEVQYLKPGERSGHDISLAVDIDAGVTIEQLVCSSHVISNSSSARDKRTVKLSSLDSIPNKDFVLRYKVAGKTVKSALVTHRDERGGFFTMMLYPPENLSYLNRAPMEMIFVLDCSGSMSGKPIAKAKQAITRALRKLQPGDTFQVIRFSNNASQLGPNPVPATPANIRKGLKYVESLQGGGGTMMIEGIKAALGFEHDPRRFRLVSFMTDGYIGNEEQILAEVHNSLGASRIFSFGVGSSVNRYLLDRMAALGKGAVAYIGLDDSAGQLVDQFYDRISHPALADVTIDWGTMEVADVRPYRVPDLFVGRPVIITGRFKGAHNTTIRVKGSVGDLTQEIDIPVNLEDSTATHPGIACVWARKRIETLGNLATYDSNPDLAGEIRQVAFEYGLMSSYTAFIAVDSSRKTAGDHGVTVAVPVGVPDGVRYETTVQN